MLPTNPLFDPFEKLCQALTTIFAACFSFDNRLKNYSKQLADNYIDNNIDINNLSSGAALPICDLTVMLGDNHCPDYYIAGVHSVKGEGYISYTDALLFKINAFLIAQSYEAFETFLKNIMVIYLIESKEYITKDEAECFVDKRLRSKNNRKLLKCMRDRAPLLNCFEKINSRNIDLRSWYEAVSEIRHAVTHKSAFILKKKIQGNIKIFLESFSATEVIDGYILEAKQHETTRAIECFGEYALLIYKCMSLSKNYKWVSGNTS